MKNAGLGVNSLAVFGNAILNGVDRYLNFGPTAGSGGYGIRDNAGTIELKNSSGVWASPTAGGRISGEVAAFNLSACPPSWTALATAAGRFIVGTGSNGTNSYALGASGGADSRTLTLAQMPTHSHTVTDTYPGGSPPYIQNQAGMFGVAANGGATIQTTSSVGSGFPVDTRPAYLALLYCQKI